MASYYYLISSLPDLRSDGDLPMSYQEFLVMCQAAVSEQTYRVLEELTLFSDDAPILRDWAAFYNMLAKELNHQRSIRLGKQYSAVYDKNPQISQVAQEALAAKNPLEAEQIMLDYEFRQLDQLVGLHMFDDYVLFGYALKLKLLERKSCFEHDRGEREFRRILGDVQQQVYRL